LVYGIAVDLVAVDLEQSQHAHRPGRGDTAEVVSPQIDDHQVREAADELSKIE